MGCCDLPGTTDGTPGTPGNGGSVVAPVENEFAAGTDVYTEPEMYVVPGVVTRAALPVAGVCSCGQMTDVEYVYPFTVQQYFSPTAEGIVTHFDPHWQLALISLFDPHEAVEDGEETLHLEEEELITSEEEPVVDRSDDEVDDDDALDTAAGVEYGSTSPLMERSKVYTYVEAQWVPHTCSGKSVVWSVTVPDVRESHGVDPVQEPINPGPPGPPPHTGPPLCVKIDISQMPPWSSMRMLYLSAPYCVNGISVIVAGAPLLLRFEDGEDDGALDAADVAVDDAEEDPPAVDPVLVDCARNCTERTIPAVMINAGRLNASAVVRCLLEVRIYGCGYG